MSRVPRLRDASSELAREGYTCATCGRHIVTAIVGLFSNPNVGSPTRFCDASCRQAAYRRRRAGVAENAPRQLTGGRARKLQPQNNSSQRLDKLEPWDV